MEPIIDWQISRHEIKARGKYLLETGKWADCHFLVGSEPQQLLAGHKLILAMASPVFEAMFFGGLPEKNDPIPILDVQPEAFKSLLEYIYTDKINILSVDKACELCYGAKKYMLPFVVEQCTKFLWSDLCPKNACRAYEFAKLFEEPKLQDKCLQIICTKTLDVIQDSSFDDVELSTVISILEQDNLNIDSEIDLFFAVNRFAERHGLINQNQNQQERSASASLQNSSLNLDQPMPNHDAADEIIDADASEPAASSSSQPVQNTAVNPSTSTSGQARQPEPVSIKTAIKKIRFLTLTPQQFAEGPARTNLLTQSEAFAILMNISTSNSVYPMPEGFSQSKHHRSEQQRVGFSFADSDTPSPPIQSVPVGQVLPLADSPHHHMGGVGVNSGVHHGSYMDELRNEQKFYCVRIIRQQTECLNTSVLDCSLTFTVDRSICVTGVQVPTQVLGGIVLDPNNVVPDRYSELLYAHLMDSQGSRLTYTHCTQRVRYNSLLEISFDRPVFIQRHKMYKVCVVFNKVGWYPMCEGYPTVNCDNVCFTFGVGSQSESNRDGLIRSIIFTYSREGQSGMIGLP